VTLCDALKGSNVIQIGNAGLWVLAACMDTCSVGLYSSYNHHQHQPPSKPFASQEIPLIEAELRVRPDLRAAAAQHAATGKGGKAAQADLKHEVRGFSGSGCRGVCVRVLFPGPS